MEQYTYHKGTGNDWVGEIPLHWSEKRLKYFTTINDEVLTDDTPEEYEFKYVDIGNVSLGKFDGDPPTLTFKQAPSKARRIIHTGDVLVSTVRTYLKAITSVTEEFDGQIASTGFAVVRPGFAVNDQFLFYLLITNVSVETMCSISVGVSYPATNAADIGNIRYYLPPLPEQEAIASFLDHKNKLIDDLIAKKQGLIELKNEERAAFINQVVTKGLDPNVPMKDSGIEWLGEIPEHWTVKKMKYVAQLKGGENLTSEQISDDAIYQVFGGNGHRGYYDQYTHEGSFVLIGRQDAVCGNINYAHGKFWATEHAIVTTLEEGYNLIWFGELLRSMNLNQYSVSAAQPGLSVESIKVLQIPVPSSEEQAQITKTIETCDSSAEVSIKMYNREIELLKEYKNTLISEAVTGKIKVIS